MFYSPFRCLLEEKNIGKNQKGEQMLKRYIIKVELKIILINEEK